VGQRGKATRDLPFDALVLDHVVEPEEKTRGVSGRRLGVEDVSGLVRRDSDEKLQIVEARRILLEDRSVQVDEHLPEVGIGEAWVVGHDHRPVADEGDQ
jgi:hypothetical protein